VSTSSQEATVNRSIWLVALMLACGTNHEEAPLGRLIATCQPGASTTRAASGTCANLTDCQAGCGAKFRAQFSRAHWRAASCEQDAACIADCETGAPIASPRPARRRPLRRLLASCGPDRLDGGFCKTFAVLTAEAAQPSPPFLLRLPSQMFSTCLMAASPDGRSRALVHACSAVPFSCLIACAIAARGCRDQASPRCLGQRHRTGRSRRTSSARRPAPVRPACPRGADYTERSALSPVGQVAR